MKIEVEIDDETAKHLNRLLALLDRESLTNTHGPLDLSVLARCCWRTWSARRGNADSWEGSIMGDLLIRHGYGPVT